jgi:hypothetical protein
MIISDDYQEDLAAKIFHRWRVIQRRRRKKDSHDIKKTGRRKLRRRCRHVRVKSALHPLLGRCTGEGPGDASRQSGRMRPCQCSGPCTRRPPSEDFLIYSAAVFV